jgi:hypothetical protein
MAKVTADMILKPGAALTVRKIDFTDPDVAEFVRQAVEQQKAILRHRIVSDKTLRQIINL